MQYWVAQKTNAPQYFDGAFVQKFPVISVKESAPDYKLGLIFLSRSVMGKNCQLPAGR